MKRNSILKYFGVAVACSAVALTSCSDEPASNASNASDGETLILELNMVMPFSSRSYTQDNGTSSNNTLPGNPKENTLSTVNLYFAEVIKSDDTSQDEVIYSLTGINGDDEIKDISVQDGKITKKVTKKVDARHFAAMMAGKEIRLYVAGNCNPESFSKPAEASLSFSGIVNFGTDGGEVPLMNSAASSIMNFRNKTLNDILEALEEKAKEKEQDPTIDLTDNSKSDLAGVGSFGTVTLERAYARLDYKDGATGTEPHLYQLGESGLYLKITQMVPLNVAKEEYLFRHTAAGTKSAAGDAVSLFGTENGGGTGYTWVADVDWATKKTSTTITDGFFNDPKANDLVWTSLDNSFGKTAYKEWCYVAENTLPSVAKMIQGLSTGVAFKVKLCNSNGSPATKAQLTASNAAWAGKLKFAESGSNLTIADNRMGPIALEVKNGEFYLTYYYWIRHNDNSQSVSETDPMEFAVVRNNIYQLSVTKFQYLPFEYKPGDKDEQEVPDVKEQAMTVKVRVKPWNWFKIDETI